MSCKKAELYVPYLQDFICQSHSNIMGSGQKKRNTQTSTVLFLGISEKESALIRKKKMQFSLHPYEGAISTDLNVFPQGLIVS